MQAPVVLVADDHPLFRAALRLAIERALPGAAVSESGDLAALQAAITAHPEADLVLLDLEARWQVTEAGFRSKSANSWLLGETLQGQPRLTIAVGRVAHDLGAVPA